MATLLREIPAQVPIGWIGWGYDYYPDLIFGDPTGDSQYLPETRAILRQLARQQTIRKCADFRTWSPHRLRRRLARSMHRAHDLTGVHPAGLGATFDRFSLFAPRLPREYALVAKKFSESIPPFAEFHYRDVETYRIFEHLRHSGSLSPTASGLLVGNAAEPVVNHLDALVSLGRHGVVFPLVTFPGAYGNARYLDLVQRYFRKRYSASSVVMREFLPLKEYAERINQYSAFFHAGLRNHGGWNISAMLAGNRRIFLRSENPLLSHLREVGAVVHEFSDLAYSSQLWAEPFDAVERRQADEYWDLQVAHSDSRIVNIEFINRLLDCRNK